MSAINGGHAHGHGAGQGHGGHGGHDWHSAAYVADWVERDATREAERRPMLDRMMEAAPASAKDAVTVLDVGGGAGAVTEALLRHYPKATVVLQDYAEAMLAHARQRLAAWPAVSFVQSDLADPDWPARTPGGPFDFAISAIAIHNLKLEAPITAVYRGVRSLLKPGGCFLNCDYFVRCGGVDLHQRMLANAGFTGISVVGEFDHAHILKARA